MRLPRSNIAECLAILASLVILPLLGGCATNRLVNTWKDPSYSDGPLKKVLVVAIRKDPVRRRIWEDNFVQELGAHRVSAVPSYELFPAAAPDTQQVIDAVRKDGYDGMVISARLPDSAQTTYVPGYTTRQPVVVYGPMFLTYATYYQEVQVPGYTETDQVRSFQTDVWTTGKGGRLIWSGTIETIEAPSVGAAQDAIRRQIVPALVEADVLPPIAK